MRFLAFVFAVLLAFPAWAQAPTSPSAAPPVAAPDARGYISGGGLVPVPDPTDLTTKAVDRAVEALNKQWGERFKALEEARKLDREDAKRVPTELDRAITNMEKLFTERFMRVDAQFQSDKLLREQLGIANSTAIAAALQAAEKAVAASNAERVAATAKSDATFTEQLKTLQALFTTDAKNLNDKVNLLREELTRVQAIASSAKENKTDNRADYLGIISLVVAGVAFAGLLLALFRRNLGRDP